VKHILIIVGRSTNYAWGTFNSPEEANAYASKWLEKANYQVIPMHKPRKEEKSETGNSNRGDGRRYSGC
jgi:hypothetical protein